MRRRVWILLFLALAVVVTACDDDRSDNVVEAREGNEAVVGDVRYRVEFFRELNAHEEPKLHRGPPPPAGAGYFAAFVRACATGEEPVRSTSSIHLENAFGKTYRALAPKQSGPVAYRATTLEPGECQPDARSLAGRALPGAVLVFEVPFEDLSARPMVLEIRDGDSSASARIQLDL